MSKFLLAAFAVLLSVSVAHAGWNIQQQSDGSTVWVDDEGNKIPVGDPGHTVHITDLSTAATAFVVSHRDGKIKKVYAIGSGTTTGTAGISVGIGTGVTGTAYTPISLTSAGSAAHIEIVAGVGGVLYTYTPADVNVDVNQGEVISVSTDGGSTTLSLGTVIIVIE